eukprot:640092-Rhodomonas_salina.4
MATSGRVVSDSVFTSSRILTFLCRSGGLTLSHTLPPSGVFCSWHRTAGKECCIRLSPMSLGASTSGLSLRCQKEAGAGQTLIDTMHDARHVRFSTTQSLCHASCLQCLTARLRCQSPVSLLCHHTLTARRSSVRCCRAICKHASRLRQSGAKQTCGNCSSYGQEGRKQRTNSRRYSYLICTVLRAGYQMSGANVQFGRQQVRHACYRSPVLT